MSRLRLCVLIAVMLATITGCGNSTTTDDSSSDSVRGQEDISVVDTSTDATNSQLTERTANSQNESETADSTTTKTTDSSALKQALIDATFDLMKAQDPNTKQDAARAQVEKAIAQIRKDVPEFLVVSAETEQKLQAGTPIEGSAKRIAEAEGFFSEFGIQHSGLVTSLLPRHKAGDLSPVHTELLAQLIVADMKKAQQALSN